MSNIGEKEMILIDYDYPEVHSLWLYLFVASLLFQENLLEICILLR